MLTDKIFINLTNGIEAIEKYSLDISQTSFLRIQSSHFEAHKFEDVICELDHNFLMSLALGYNCIVYDFGARAESAKAIHTGLEWIKFVLYKRWFGRDYKPIVKTKDVTNYFAEIYSDLSGKYKKKTDYYKKYLMTDAIKLTGICGSTLNDNKPEFYREILARAVNSI